MKKKLKKSFIRTLVQIIFFVLVFLVVLAHSLEEVGITIPLFKGASLHAICPFGGVVTIYQFVTSGTFVQKIHEASFYLMIVVFISAIIAGPIFCGWVCPFGTFQEWIGKIGKKIFKKKYNNFIPNKIDSLLRYLRYFVLIWVLVMTAISATLVFSSYDPYYALFNFWTGEVAISGFITLAIIIIFSLFIERPFCKYACPYGALLGITNLFRIFSVKRNSNTCISCKACDKACPMNIKISDKNSVKNHQCISCLRCTSEDKCPVESTLELNMKTPNKDNSKFLLNYNRSALLSLVLILGGILLLMSLGLWKTESSKVPIKIATGEFAGLSDPADIRGSYTFEDIENNFDISAEILADAFALDTSEKEAKLYKAKDLEEIYSTIEGLEGEVGTDSVKLFVSLYLGIPYEAEETTLLPSPALNILRDLKAINDEEFQILKTRSISPSSLDMSNVIIEEESNIETVADGVLEIKGSTTFNDLIDLGIEMRDIEEIMGYKIESTSQTIRDFSVEKELEFSEYKLELQNIVNNM